MSANRQSDSLEFIFDHIRDAPERQIESADSLDSKMVQIFVSASIIIGLAGLSSNTVNVTGWELIPLMGAILSYVAVAWVALMHLRPRAMRRNLHANVLWPKYGRFEIADVKEVLAQDTSEAYAFNKGVLADKATTVRQALLATAVEVVLVGVTIATPLLREWFS